MAIIPTLIKHNATLRTLCSWLWVMLIMLGYVVTGCKNRDLYPDDTYRVRVPVSVEFDWSGSPEADPASMSVYFFREGSPSSLSFEFSGKDGQRIMLDSGVYDIICYNSDSGAHDIVDTDSYYDFALRLNDARRAGMFAISPSSLPKVVDERISNTPDPMWAATLERVEIKAPDSGESPSTMADQIICLAPQTIVNNYRFIIRHPQNFHSSMSVSASVTGMASKVHPGRGLTGDETVTHFFSMHPASGGELHGNVIVFGHCSGKPIGVDRSDTDTVPHILTIYATMNDGKTWYSTHDVTDQIHFSVTPDCEVVVDSLELPKQSGTGGFYPVIDGWKDIVIPIGT